MNNYDNSEANNPILHECVVCLWEVEPEVNEFKKLLNCNHGVQFHRGCIESWLKNHSTRLLCRSHVQRPVHQWLNAYIFKLRDDIVLYCNIALENVAS
ncbi:zinc finger, RING/FYVE/PHD-type containing protein [Tanacetum coccineum]